MADPDAKWFQVAEQLRKAIKSGEYPPGSLVPTEAELNRLYGISRTTARAALNKLAAEGLIIRQRGIGSRVVEPKVDRPASQIGSFATDMRSRGIEPSYKINAIGWSPATPEVAQALELPAAEDTFHVERTLEANGRIVGLSSSWLRPDIFLQSKPPTTSDLTEGSMYTWLARHCNVLISGGVEFIEARTATGTIAAQLEVPANSALLVATRIAKSTNEIPVEYAVVHYRADRYRFRVEL